SPIFANYPSILKDHHIIEFICDYLRIMVAGNMAPHELESLMEQELDGHHQENAVIPGAIQNAADGLPGFGIVAAVLGIIITMSRIGGPPEEIGAAVAAALVGTLLGILFAYGFIGPFASYLNGKVRDESRAFECIKAVLVASMNGVPPQVAVEFGRKVLFHSARPSFQELEEQYRASKKLGRFMEKNSAQQPLIIKKKKGHGHGHHGGSWKVALADFMTAMMAFFLLMWILGSTSTEEKKAISGYFNDPGSPYAVGDGGAELGAITQDP